MKKVYLIAPSEKDILTDAGDRPPLGILYLASVLKQNNIPVKVCDLNHKLKDEMLMEIEQWNPDFIGLSFTTPLYEQAIKLVKELKLYSNAKFIAGGPHPSADPTSCNMFDYVVVGEGENVIMELVRE